MKLYYATLATDDALDDVMRHGIRRADGAPVVVLTEAPDLATRVAWLDNALFGRDSVEMFVYSVELPPGEKVAIIASDGVNITGLPTVGYPGDIPPDWIDHNYTSATVTAKKGVD